MYLIGLSLKFCYLEFNDILLLAEALRFNHSLIKLDLSNNALKSCVIKYFLELLVDNACLVDLKLAGNYLDNEFAVDLAHLLEVNEVLHTVDISKNPIGPDGARYLLKSLLQHNDTLESLGPDDELDKSIYMGVRIREELKQTLKLNVSSHERKRAIMNKIAQTKAKNPKEKGIDKPNAPGAKKKTKVADDPECTATLQMSYPMLKPMAFTNQIEDEYLASGVWNLKQ